MAYVGNLGMLANPLDTQSNPINAVSLLAMLAQKDPTRTAATMAMSGAAPPDPASLKNGGLELQLGQIMGPGGGVQGAGQAMLSSPVPQPAATGEPPPGVPAGQQSVAQKVGGIGDALSAFAALQAPQQQQPQLAPSAGVTPGRGIDPAALQALQAVLSLKGAVPTGAPALGDLIRGGGPHYAGR